MLLEPLRGKDDSIDLGEKNSFVVCDPTDFWLLIKRIIIYVLVLVFVSWMGSQLINEVQR